MPEYLAPGVYVEEVDTGPLPIAGVGTSTAGFVGMTKRGPTSGPPELVTSFGDFERRFGGHFADAALDGHTLLSHAVEGFFVNGGQRVYITRVKGQGGSPAQTTLKGGLVTRLLADAQPAATSIRLATLRHVQVGVALKLTQVKDGLATESPAIPVTGYNRSTNEVSFATALTDLFEARYTVVTSVATAGPPAIPAIARGNAFKVVGKDEGKWGDDIAVRTEHLAGASSPVVAYVTTAAATVTVRSGAGFYVGAHIEFDRGRHKVFRKVVARDGVVLTMDAPFAANELDPELAGPPVPPTMATVCEFRLSASYQGVDEQFSGLTLENVPGHYYKTIIDNGSTLITAEAPPGGTSPLSFPMGEDGVTTRLGGGNNGTAPNAADYIGTDGGAGSRTGLQAMVDIDEVAILAVPGRTEQEIQSALISQCELLKDRFAILDPENKKQTLQEIQDQRSQFDTKYAAIYFPRVQILDPLTNTVITAPPSGHVAGIYARTDVERGVHKAPANVVIRGITGLEQNITRGEQEILNPRNINVLRDLRSQGRGYRVWGARCMTSNPMWKYVPVRRLFIFLEESLDEGTQTFVFEPNDERLWPRVRQSISNFLSQVWRDGALMGTKPEEAYFVHCDRTTMSQQDIETGRLIVIVGVAPVFPAEFVIIRISQWSGGSSVEEL